MTPSNFDSIARLFAARRLSRRSALAGGGAELAAAGLAAAGLSGAVAHAQEATPAPTGAAADTGETLFVQSFESGRIAPKAAADGTYTLTLEHGLGRTIYFTDRPERVVGTSPTPAFLKALGFSPANPPNAALVVEAAPGDEAIAVLELANPRYDEGTRTATYDVQVLQDWERTLEMGFSEEPTGLAQLAPSFGAAHLFIDDCPDIVNCYAPGLDGGSPVKMGPLPGGPQGRCYSWRYARCLPCDSSGNWVSQESVNALCGKEYWIECGDDCWAE
jgi:hypothetical protein